MAQVRLTSVIELVLQSSELRLRLGGGMAGVIEAPVEVQQSSRATKTQITWVSSL